MIIINKKIAMLLVGLGKTKSIFASFFLLLILFFLWQFIAAAVFFVFGQESFIRLLQEQITANWLYIFFFFPASLVYYDVAYDHLSKLNEMDVKGLTYADVRRIGFVTNWGLTRKNGQTRFCFFDGGIIAGMLLVIPISLICFFAIDNFKDLFSSLNRMLGFIGLTAFAGYFAGTIIYYLRWIRNERRYLQLTKTHH